MAALRQLFLLLKLKQEAKKLGIRDRINEKSRKCYLLVGCCELVLSIVLSSLFGDRRKKWHETNSTFNVFFLAQLGTRCNEACYLTRRYVLEQFVGMIVQPGQFPPQETLDVDMLMTQLEFSREVAIKLPDDDVIDVSMTNLTESLLYPIQGEKNLNMLLSLLLIQMKHKNVCLQDFFFYYVCNSSPLRMCKRVQIFSRCSRVYLLTNHKLNLPFAYFGKFSSLISKF